MDCHLRTPRKQLRRSLNMKSRERKSLSAALGQEPSETRPGTETHCSIWRMAIDPLVYLGRDLQDHGPLLSQQIRMLFDSMILSPGCSRDVLGSRYFCPPISSEDGTEPLIEIGCFIRRMWLRFKLEASQIPAADLVLPFQFKERRKNTVDIEGKCL